MLMKKELKEAIKVLRKDNWDDVLEVRKRVR
jgi:hypothetical protein